MSSAPPTTTAAPAQETTVPTAPAEDRKRRRRAGPPLFSGADPSPSPAPESPTAGPLGPGPFDGDASTGFEGPRGADSGAKRPSAAPSSRGPFSKAELRRALVGGVQGVSYLAAENLQRDEIDEQLERFVATDEEAEHLADPLASLAARRMNGPGGMLNPDVADVINALVVVATYVTRQLKLRSVARRIRRGETTLVTDDAGPDAGEPEAARV